MSSSVFDEPRTRLLLGTACAQAGLPAPVTAELLSLGENAVLAVDHLVVKIGRGCGSLRRAERELRIAEWLAGQSIPAVRPAPGLSDRPLLVDGHPVTFWQRLPAPVRPAEPADLAELLREVHRLPAPPFPLPRRELLQDVERWLRAAEGHIDPADAACLRARSADHAEAMAELTPCLPPGPVHGDALPRNVHMGPQGPVLLDLETFSDDLREHDLVVMALDHDRYGTSDVAYRSFTETYGWDVREWPGCAVLRGARETAGACWMAQSVPGNPAALAEFRRRVDSLRNSDPTVRWYSLPPALS